MIRLIGPLGVALTVLLAVLFTAFNGTQRVSLNLGFFTLYGVPLVLVAFGGVMLGMLVMLAAGVDADLRVRKILRDRLVAEDQEERERFVDQNQQDLFQQEDGSL